MNWDLSSAPYCSIRRRVLLRRRIIAAGLAIAAVAVFSFVRHRAVSEPVGQRIFDDVATTVSARYYDPAFNGTAWSQILAQYRPLVVAARDERQRYRLLRRMLSRLGDSHTAAYAPTVLEGRSDSALGVTGARFGMIGGRTVVLNVVSGSPADKAGMHPGVLVAPHDLQDAPIGARRSFNLEDPQSGKRWTATLQLAPAAAMPILDPPPIEWTMDRAGIGYLRISSFPDAINDVIQWALQDKVRVRGLILDLRANPGGYMDSVDAVAGVFLDRGTLIATGRRRYRWLPDHTFTATSVIGVRYSGPVVVIVDETTQSGAETLAAALQMHRRALIVGRRTARKVMGVDVEEPLADGGLLKVATLDIRAPDGRRLEGRGVTPDIIVGRTAKDVARGIDPPRSFAAAILSRTQRKQDE